MKFFKFMNLTWHSAKNLNIAFSWLGGRLAGTADMEQQVPEEPCWFSAQLPSLQQMSFPGDLIFWEVSLGSGRAGIALPSCGLGSTGTPPGPPGHPNFHSQGLGPSSHLRELSGGFVTRPAGFQCSSRLESWEARLGVWWLCQVRGNSLGFRSGKAKQAPSCAWSCSYRSVEGERIFHLLIITEDEQTMTTLCPLGLIIKMKNLKSLSVVFCLKFWKMLPADCIQRHSLVPCGIAGFSQQLQRQQSLFSSDPGRRSISTWLMYLKVCFLYIVLIVLQSAPYNGEAFMWRIT